MADAVRAVHPPCHVVALPFPGCGHIKAMLSLCRLLAARGIATTVILTEEWLGLVGAAEPPLPARVRLTAIPNVIPSEHGRAANYSVFRDAVNTKMEAPVERLLELEGMLLPSPDMPVVVADLLLQWAVLMALRRGMKACTFCPFSATNFAALYHFQRLMAGSSLAVEDPMWDQYTPGQTCMTMRDFQPILSDEASRGRLMAQIQSARAAQFVIFSSFYELEAGVMDSLISEPSSPRVYAIGPCIPYTALEEEPRGECSYRAWLDTQPAGSVLYVSLGSFLSLPPSQLAELAMGLAVSNVKFLRVVRDEAHSHVRSLLGGNGNGVLVPWCDQLKVLCHPSVGGFLTHCGMNSALEAVFAGVPMLTLPIAMDQPTNSRLIVDVWKIGYSLKAEMTPEGVITAEEIAQAVKTLMSSSDLPESKGVRRRASLLRDASRRAIQEGGSSSSDMNSFLSSIV